MMQPSASELGELEGRTPLLPVVNVRFAAIYRTTRAKRLFHISCLSDRIVGGSVMSISLLSSDVPRWSSIAAT